MRPYLAELARIADCYVSCYPNAGLPNAFGQYDEQPNETGDYLREFAASGFVNIVGGCCGTTPEHIAAIAKGVAGLPPRMVGTPEGVPYTGDPTAVGRRFSGAAEYTQFAGLEPLTIRPDANFQMIGERTNVTGSARFARLIKAGNYAEATSV